jgi:hypothetical protein
MPSTHSCFSSLISPVRFLANGPASDDEDADSGSWIKDGLRDEFGFEFTVVVAESGMGVSGSRVGDVASPKGDPKPTFSMELEAVLLRLTRGPFS